MNLVLVERIPSARPQWIRDFCWRCNNWRVTILWNLIYPSICGRPISSGCHITEAFASNNIENQIVCITAAESLQVKCKHSSHHQLPVSGHPLISIIILFIPILRITNGNGFSASKRHSITKSITCLPNECNIDLIYSLRTFAATNGGDDDFNPRFTVYCSSQLTSEWIMSRCTAARWTCVSRK